MTERSMTCRRRSATSWAIGRWMSGPCAAAFSVADTASPPRGVDDFTREDDRRARRRACSTHQLSDVTAAMRALGCPDRVHGRITGSTKSSSLETLTGTAARGSNLNATSSPRAAHSSSSRDGDAGPEAAGIPIARRKGDGSGWRWRWMKQKDAGESRRSMLAPRIGRGSM